MFFLGANWIELSRMLRRWITLRVYRGKIVWDDRTPYLPEPLTVLEKTVVFSLHLVILAALATAIISAFILAMNAIYG